MRNPGIRMVLHQQPSDLHIFDTDHRIHGIVELRKAKYLKSFMVLFIVFFYTKILIQFIHFSKF